MKISKLPKSVRPTEARVKKALFDIVGDVSGLSFLELFAGAGTVGFEALLRGAARVIFVENNSSALRLLRQEAGLIKNLPPPLILPLDVFETLARFSKNSEKFDIIFLDPPYYYPIRNDRYLRHLISNGVNHMACHVRGKTPEASVSSSVAKKTLQTLDSYDILSFSGVILAQHYKKDLLPEKLENLTLLKQYKYGDTVLSLFVKKVTRNQ